MQPVEVKVKMHNKRDNLRKRNAHPKQKPWRTAKPMIDREAAWCLLTVFGTVLQTRHLAELLAWNK